MTPEQIETLLEQGQEHGCIELSTIEELVQEHDLADHEVESLYEQIETRGIELRDDCGREQPDSTYVNGDWSPRRRTPSSSS